MKIEFNNQQLSYPIVLLPEPILKSLRSVLEDKILDQLVRLNKPKLKGFKKPEQPSRFKSIKTTEKKFEQANGCMIFVVLIISIACGFTFSNSFVEGILYSILIMTIEALIFFIGGIPLVKYKDEIVYKQIIKSDEEYSAELKKYKEDFNKYQMEKPRKEKEFEENLKQYNSTFKEEKLNIAKEIHYDKLNATIQANRGRPPIKRGMAELHFLEKLSKELKDYVFIDMVPQSEEFTGNSYNPDFTLICPKTKLHIDIEIDEPYSLKDKVPIHYINSDDEARNQFFLSNNWCIIRFTEKQIITEAQECINTIKSVYNSILNIEKTYESKLEHENRWSYEEAFIYSNNNFREQYLK